MINFSYEKIAGYKVLVTGGAGFIGSNLCETLLSLCDIMDKKLGRDEGNSAKHITYIKDLPAHEKRYAIDATKNSHKNLQRTCLEAFGNF